MNGESKKPARPADAAVPDAVVQRLSFYLRELQQMARDGKQTTNSKQLGKLLGFTDAQVRKDLAYFGHFGHPGIGYQCDELMAAIRKILGTDQNWPVVLMGVGNLGHALLGYRGFRQQGFQVVAAFDDDPAKIGTQVEQVPVYASERLPNIAQEHKIRLGIIAVPSGAAQAVADQLVAAGIEGIVNFAPVTIVLPEGVSQVGVDLAIELEQLSFSVANRLQRIDRKQDE